MAFGFLRLRRDAEDPPLSKPPKAARLTRRSASGTAGNIWCGSRSNSAATANITSNFVKALRRGAQQNQSPNRDKQGLLGKLFGDIGSIG